MRGYLVLSESPRLLNGCRVSVLRLPAGGRGVTADQGFGWICAPYNRPEVHSFMSWVPMTLELKPDRWLATDRIQLGVGPSSVSSAGAGILEFQLRLFHS